MTSKISECRDVCSFCGAKGSFEKLFTLNNFPVFMGCTNESKDLDLFQDMSFSICKKCGGVQLDPYVSPSVVYKISHGSGTVGKSWAMHHAELSNFILKHAPSKIVTGKQVKIF